MQVAYMKEESVAANTTVANVLTNSRLERMPFPGWLALYATAQATGLELALFTGGQNPVQAANPRIAADGPTKDDMLVEKIFLGAGTQIQLQIANSTANAITCHYRLVAQKHVPRHKPQHK
jgi:hypothetical protein